MLIKREGLFHLATVYFMFPPSGGILPWREEEIGRGQEIPPPLGLPEAGAGSLPVTTSSLEGPLPPDDY